MRSRVLFPAVGVVAVLAGFALWWGARWPASATSQVDISPSALWAATFRDNDGQPHALGELQGNIVVVNFWATWCAPCREEMPAFTRIQARWAARGVRFVGLSDDDPMRVQQFGRDLAINYPLWVGGESVGELSRRLGNRLGVLPHTVILDLAGQPVDARVGPYPELDLESKLAILVGKGG